MTSSSDFVKRFPCDDQATFGANKCALSNSFRAVENQNVSILIAERGTTRPWRFGVPPTKTNQSELL